MSAHSWNWRFADQGQAGKWALRSQGIVSLGIGVCRRGKKGAVQSSDHHLLLFTLRGAGSFEDKGAPKKIGEGTLVILPNGARSNLAATSDWQLLWFALETTSTWSSLMPAVPSVGPASSMNVLRLVSAIFLAANRSSPPEKSRSLFEVYAQVASSLLRLELTFSGLASAGQAGRLDLLWREVQRDPIQPWTIEKLATLGGYSRSHLQAMVRQANGCGAMEMVARIRMKHSMKFLQDRSIKLTDVAERVGYQSPFSFSKAFKRIVGMTPEDFRHQA